MPVGQKQVHVPVHVEVQKLQSPAAQEPGGLSHLIGMGEIAKQFIPLILVEGEHLLVHVGHEQILPSVLIEVGGIDSHAGAGFPVGAEPHLREKTDLVPPVVSPVDEQEVLHRVVGDEEVHPAVVVDVGGDDAQRLAQ